MQVEIFREVEKMEIRILCRRRDFLVCLKEPGLESELQLPALLEEQLNLSPGTVRCVHRLDRAVGGVMVYALTPKGAAALSAQVQDHTLQKKYLALCAGVPQPAAGEMVDYLYQDKAKGRAYPVKKLRRGVKEARLEYRALASALWEGQPVSLVEVTLHTGRFHQIRCQFAARKMPLLGDGKYGSRIKVPGPALFSARLSFLDPADGQRVTCAAHPPEAEFPWSLFPLDMKTAPESQ